MAESIVSDWIADYGALTEQSEIRTFAAQHEHNHEIASALFTIVNERLKYPDVSRRMEKIFSESIYSFFIAHQSLMIGLVFNYFLPFLFNSPK